MAVRGRTSKREVGDSSLVPSSLTLSLSLCMVILFKWLPSYKSTLPPLPWGLGLIGSQSLHSYPDVLSPECNNNKKQKAIQFFLKKTVLRFFHHHHHGISITKMRSLWNDSPIERSSRPRNRSHRCRSAGKPCIYILLSHRYMLYSQQTTRHCIDITSHKPYSLLVASMTP